MRDLLVGTRVTYCGCNYLKQLAAANPSCSGTNYLCQLASSQATSGCGYLTKLASLISQLGSLLGLSNSLLGISITTCAQAILIEASDITGSPVGYTIDGSTTRPAGTYYLKEFVDYTNATSTPAITVTADNVTVNFRDNTIKLSGDSGKNGVLVQADNVTIQSGSIVGDTACSHLVYVDGTTAQIKNTVVKDMILYSSISGRGLFVDNAKDLTVRGVIADKNDSGGIYLKSVDGFLVEQCIARSNSGNQFTVDGSSSDCRGVLYKNDAIYDASQKGYYFDTPSSVHVVAKANAALGPNSADRNFDLSAADSSGTVQLVNNIAVGGDGFNNENANYTPSDWSSGASSCAFGCNIRYKGW